MEDIDVTAQDMIERLNLLEKPKPSWTRYIPHILCIIFFCLLCYQCNGNRESSVKLAKLNTELTLLKKDYKVTEKHLLAQNDSLHIENSNLEDKNSYLEEQHSKDLIEIENNHKQRDVVKAKIEKYSNNEYASWFGNRYNEVNSVTSTPNGIELKNQIPMLVAVELNAYDFAKEELQIKDKTISDYKSEVINKDGIIRNKDSEILNLNILNNELSEIQKVQDETLKQTTSDLNWEKTKTTLGKIAIPAAAVLGFIGGVYITK